MIERRSRRAPTACLLALVALLGACVTTPVEEAPTSRVTSVVRPGSVLRAGARVAWLEGSGTLRDTEEARALRPVIESALAHELRQRGFRLEISPSQRPDYYVGYLAAQTDLLDRGEVLTRFGFHQGFDDWSESFPTGTLLVLLVDARTNEMIWRASVEALLRRDLDTADRARRIDHFVERMFASLPQPRG